MRSRKTLIPVRVTVGILGCMACTLVYTLRSCLSVAIIAMVDEKLVIEDNEQNNTVLDVCYDFTSHNTTQESHYHVMYYFITCIGIGSLAKALKIFKTFL